ncbi:prolyl oligopeptidase family serine peptidase [bacterium]|nr:prolyl oligopeptidase family serine peptidase [bacterium]
MRHALTGICLVFGSFLTTFAAEPIERNWTIGDERREALVYLPAQASDTPAPLVFVFHGHGGTMRNAMRTFGLHKLWPEAVVVYPQGLNTPGQLTDPEGKRSGWQSSAGQLGDRDLKFVDKILAELKSERKIDPDRIYATGHSNGGGFTYLLWAERGDIFAALAPSSAAGLRHLPKMKPKPMLHIAGETDPLVRFPMQKRMIDLVRGKNGCNPEGKPWHDIKFCTEYDSRAGTPVVTLIHPGGHKFEATAPAAIVRFFKEHPRNSLRSNEEKPEKEETSATVKSPSASG